MHTVDINLNCFHQCEIWIRHEKLQQKVITELIFDTGNHSKLSIVIKVCMCVDIGGLNTQECLPVPCIVMCLCFGLLFPLQPFGAI